MNMKRTGLILFFIISAFFIVIFSHTSYSENTETIKLLTYYPAPYGVYRQLGATGANGVAPLTGQVGRDPNNPDTLVLMNIGVDKTGPDNGKVYIPALLQVGGIAEITTSESPPATINKAAIFGKADVGIIGIGTADEGAGVVGWATPPAGDYGVGVMGQSDNGTGVRGESDNGTGVEGEGSITGVSGTISYDDNSQPDIADGSSAVEGNFWGGGNNPDNNYYGVKGTAFIDSDNGKQGNTYGVYGECTRTDTPALGIGIKGIGSGSGVKGNGIQFGVIGEASSGYGVLGRLMTTNCYSGVIGTDIIGDPRMIDYAPAISPTIEPKVGVYGYCNEVGIMGTCYRSGNEVAFEDKMYGVVGKSNHCGVYGMASGSAQGGLHTNVIGIMGTAEKNNWDSDSNTIGVYGKAGSITGSLKITAGVYGECSTDGGYAGYFDGDIYTTENSYASTRTGGSIDIAEYIPASQTLEPGDVVIINPDNCPSVIKSIKPYDTTVAGIVSTKPGYLLGIDNKNGNKKDVKLCLAGRVPCKVTTENGPIKPGDLLTTSSRPGYAMKARPIGKINGYPIYPQGCIVAKALEGLKKGKGKILVLVSLM